MTQLNNDLADKRVVLSALAVLLGLGAITSRADIALRIESGSVAGGESITLGIFLEDGSVDPRGVDLESFNIPVLIDGLSLSEHPVSNGIFDPEPFFTHQVGNPSPPFFADIAIAQLVASGFVNTGASARLFDLTILTSSSDAGQSFNIDINPSSIFFQLNTTTTDDFEPSTVLSGTLSVLPDSQLCGDFDGDGDVDAADRTIQTIGWTGALREGEGDATFADGDCDGDGDVDSADAVALTINWTGALGLAPHTVGLVFSDDPANRAELEVFAPSGPVADYSAELGVREMLPSELVPEPTAPTLLFIGWSVLYRRRSCNIGAQGSTGRG